MNSNTQKKYLIEPAVSAAVLGGLVYALYGNSGSAKLLGMSVSPVVVLSTSMFAADIVGTLVTDTIGDQLSLSAGLDELQTKALKPVINGFALMATSRAIIGEFTDMKAMGIVGGMGVASTVGGSYIVDMIP